jgi:hypothetical protein
MSISNNNQRGRRKRPIFSLIGGGGAAGACVIIIALALLAGGFAPISPIIATATPSNNTTTATTTSPGIELSSQPVYQERQKNVGETPINQTHSQFTLSGNGTLTLPNGTETINTTSTGSVVVSTIDGTASGKEMLTTEDGTESATATFYGIARFNMENGTGRGIIISLVHTNSTGRLAPLDGMILAGQIEFQPDQTGLLTLWEWQSRIPYMKMPPQVMQESPMNNTTTNTTTTTASELPPMNVP